jgi:hypothetical protein
VKDSLIQYSDITFECDTIRMEIDGMSDEALIDECNEIMATSLESTDMDQIIIKYFKAGKLSKEDRARVEGFYVLSYLQLGWEE